MKFVIRDDDLNYFSKPADVERWYADIFARRIPVGFSAIPFVTGASDVYTDDAPQDGIERAISDNRELIDYVKDNPLVEIMQHGTTHETINGVFEYARTVPINEARRGKAELERAFGAPVHVFVPPHDWIGTAGIRSIEAVGIDVIRGRGAGLRNWLWRWQYASTLLKMLWFRFPHYISTHARVYPYVLDFGAHKELCSYRLEDADIFEGLQYTHKKDGIFVVVAHLHFYTPEKKERLMRLIKEAQQFGAEFVTPSEIFS